jgi:hypothetical protein
MIWKILIVILTLDFVKLCIRNAWSNYKRFSLEVMKQSVNKEKI